MLGFDKMGAASPAPGQCALPPLDTNLLWWPNSRGTEDAGPMVRAGTASPDYGRRRTGALRLKLDPGSTRWQHCRRQAAAYRSR